ALADPFDHFFDCALVRDVKGHATTTETALFKIVADGLGARGCGRGANNSTAIPRQLLGDGATDAAAGAGDQCYRVAVFHAGDPFLCCEWAQASASRVCRSASGSSRE